SRWSSARRTRTGGSLMPAAELLLAFAKCMRSHRVPAFPDPQVVDGHIHIRVTAGQIDPNSPVVTAAAAACRSKLGTGRGSESGAEKLVQGAAGMGKYALQQAERDRPEIAQSRSKRPRLRSDHRAASGYCRDVAHGHD